MAEGNNELKMEKLEKMSREKILKRLRGVYARSGKKDKGAVLDQYCGATGLSRKHAIVQFGGGTARRRSGARRGRPVTYDRSLCDPLALVWRASGYSCAELLHPAMQTLLEQLKCHGRLKLVQVHCKLLLQMSCATLKRLLGTLPHGRRPRRLRRERPVHARVPLSCLQPKPARRGTFECDLVEHNGGSSSGEYIYTVHMVDVVTAWRSKRACLGKHPQRIIAQLEQMRARLPYALEILDIDNDRSLLNEAVEAWTTRHGGRMTRSRPYKKNDNAHIEQKNGTDVRGLVGYRRYDTRAQCDLLNQLYALDDLHVNYCVPGRKLMRRVRDDDRGTWRKYYDTPRTPLQRVLEHADEEVAPAIKAQLRAQAARLDPLALQEAKERLLVRLLQTPTRAQETATLSASAAPKRRVAYAAIKPETGTHVSAGQAYGMCERQQRAHAAPSLRLSSSLRGSAQSRRSLGRQRQAFWYNRKGAKGRPPPAALRPPFG